MIDLFFGFWLYNRLSAFCVTFCKTGILCLFRLSAFCVTFCASSQQVNCFPGHACCKEVLYKQTTGIDTLRVVRSIAVVTVGSFGNVR